MFSSVSNIKVFFYCNSNLIDLKILLWQSSFSLRLSSLNSFFNLAILFFFWIFIPENADATECICLLYMWIMKWKIFLNNIYNEDTYTLPQRDSLSFQTLECSVLSVFFFVFFSLCIHPKSKVHIIIDQLLFETLLCCWIGNSNVYIGMCLGTVLSLFRQVKLFV